LAVSQVTGNLYPRAKISTHILIVRISSGVTYIFSDVFGPSGCNSTRAYSLGKTELPHPSHNVRRLSLDEEEQTRTEVAEHPRGQVRRGPSADTWLLGLPSSRLAMNCRLITTEELDMDVVCDPERLKERLLAIGDSYMNTVPKIEGEQPPAAIEPNFLRDASPEALFSMEDVSQSLPDKMADDEQKTYKEVLGLGLAYGSQSGIKIDIPSFTPEEIRRARDNEVGAILSLPPNSTVREMLAADSSKTKQELYNYYLDFDTAVAEFHETMAEQLATANIKAHPSVKE